MSTIHLSVEILGDCLDVVRREHAAQLHTPAGMRLSVPIPAGLPFLRTPFLCCACHFGKGGGERFNQRSGNMHLGERGRISDSRRPRAQALAKMQLDHLVETSVLTSLYKRYDREVCMKGTLAWCGGPSCSYPEVPYTMARSFSYDVV
jgi:hypothetical protein